MSMKVASYVIFLLALAAIYIAVRRFRYGNLPTRLFLMWVILWLAMGFFAVFPAALDWLGGLVMMQNRMFFLFTTAIILLFVVVFYLSARLADVNRRLVRLSQHIAIGDHERMELSEQTYETKGEMIGGSSSQDES